MYHTHYHYFNLLCHTVNNIYLSPCHTCSGNSLDTQAGYPWECTASHQVVYHIHSNRNALHEMPFLLHMYTLLQRSAASKHILKVLNWRKFSSCLDVSSILSNLFSFESFNPFTANLGSEVLDSLCENAG